MPRKGENIYKRKDGRWEGRYIKYRSISGKIKYGYVYAKSYCEIKQKLAVLRAQPPSTFIGAANREKKLDFFDIAEEWISLRKPQLKQSTYVKYRNLLNSYIIPFFGELSLSELSCDDVKLFCNELLSSGGTHGCGLSGKTVSDILSLIRNILKYAAENKKMSVCDLSSITVKQPLKELRVFSRKEEEQLCRFLYANLNLQSIGILLCIFTGIRIGELCALRWEDISLNERTIHIHQTMQRIQEDIPSGKKTKVIVTSPKSSSSIRIIPLSESLTKILENFYFPSGYFLTGSVQKFIEPRTMQNYFKRVLKACSIENANYHALRHTFATRCVELGVDIKSLSEILGHSSVTITLERYVHPSMELKRENMERLSKLFPVR